MRRAFTFLVISLILQSCNMNNIKLEDSKKGTVIKAKLAPVGGHSIVIKAHL